MRAFGVAKPKKKNVPESATRVKMNGIQLMQSALWRCVTMNGGRPNQLRRLNENNNERHGIIVKWRNDFILWNINCYEICQNLAGSLMR